MSGQTGKPHIRHIRQYDGIIYGRPRGTGIITAHRRKRLAVPTPIQMFHNGGNGHTEAAESTGRKQNRIKKESPPQGRPSENKEWGKKALWPRLHLRPPRRGSAATDDCHATPTTGRHGRSDHAGYDRKCTATDNSGVFHRRRRKPRPPIVGASLPFRTHRAKARVALPLSPPPPRLRGRLRATPSFG